MNRVATASILVLLQMAPVSGHAAGKPHPIVTPRGQIVFELTGQTAIAPPYTATAVRIQYGYLSYLHGITRLFRSSVRDSTTALYTFFTRATATDTSLDGPLKIITRRGTTTLYRHLSAHATFDDPSSLRRGEPIQTSSLQQQVVVDTANGGFTAVNLNTVVTVKSFALGGRAVQLGRAGDRFQTTITGHLSAGGQGPPCGYIGGYAVEIGSSPRRPRYQAASSGSSDSFRSLLKYPC